LGRGKSCKIKIDSNFLSKHHTTIEYNNNSKFWEIKDGFESKSSLNGTWLLLDSKFELIDETFIKIGNHTIKLYFQK